MNELSAVIGIINTMLVMVDVIIKLYELYLGR